MKAYLVCSLDPEHYDDAEFKFCKTLGEALQTSEKNCKAFAVSCNRDFNYKDVDYGKDIDSGNSYWYYNWYNDYALLGEFEFYSNRIIELDISKGDFLCIFSHAYLGVSFNVIGKGGKEKCYEMINEKALAKYEALAKALKPSTPSDYDKNETEDRLTISFDDGMEWQIWYAIQFTGFNEQGGKIE